MQYAMRHTQSQVPIEYTQTFRMGAYEAGVHCRLSMGALCNYLQEAAAEHAAQLGFGTAYFAPLGQSWVLHRLRIELTGLPTWPDDVTVYTWPSGTEAVRATREFLVSAPSCGEFARVTSVWLLLDMERRRPVRMPAHLRQLQPLNTERAVELHEPPVPPDTEGTTDERKVYHSDLDANGHVNNVRIATWITDSARPDPTWQPRQIDIVFQKEVLPGRVVRIQTAHSTGEKCFRHALSTSEDGILALAETVWSD